VGFDIPQSGSGSGEKKGGKRSCKFFFRIRKREKKGGGSYFYLGEEVHSATCVSIFFLSEEGEKRQERTI